nr:helix-turn-helix domain-containing protein [Flavimaribacter sediminis]
MIRSKQSLSGGQVQQIWRTEEQATSDQFGYWREVVCDAFVHLNPQRCDAMGTNKPFFGEVEATRYGAVGVAHVRAQAQHVVRGTREIGRSSRSCYYLNLQVRGVGLTRQSGRDSVLAPGDFTIVDASRPYELGFGGDFHQLSLEIPTALANETLKDAENLLPGLFVSGAGGLGAVLSRYVFSLAEELRACSIEEENALMRGFLGLLAQAPATRRAIVVTDRRIRQRALLFAIKSSVGARLGDHDLKPGILARRFGISVRTLHNLFAEDGVSFGNWLLAERLKKSREALVSPDHCGRSIAEIAYAWGFSDQSHFGRAFRKKYGLAPREYRRSLLCR